MIEVKGTKTQTRDSDPSQRYVLKNADKKSKAPAIISAFLLGLIIYLKSAITLNSQAHEDEVSPMEPDNEINPEQDLAQVDMASMMPLQRNAAEKPEDNSELLGSASRIMDIFPSHNFNMIETPILNFAPLQPAIPLLSNKFETPTSYTADNDNPNPGGSYTSNAGGGTIVDPSPDNPGGDGGDDTASDEACNNTCPTECDDENEKTKNRAPVVSGPVYLRDVSGCAILAIGLADLLQNVVDPDGDVLTIQNITVSSGTLTSTANGWTFQPGPQLTGPVTLSYQVSDGEFVVTQTAHFSVEKSYIAGSDCDDNLIGTKCADDIDGGYGNDRIEGLAGDDTINGGHGDDYILGGAGNDTIFGGLGNDIIYGGSGNDHIAGGHGDDILYGEAGDDIIFGDAGNDFISGGNGKDVLSGGEGNDTILGGDGDDRILDGRGSDEIYGQLGDDYVIASLDGDDDIYDGGAGHDTLDFSATTAGVTVYLADGKATGIEIGCDTISNFETIVGGQGDDHFIASDAPTVMIGGDGQNSFEFTAPPTPTENIIMHEIIDFKNGDRIRLSKYDLFERAADKLEDRFEDIYGRDFDDENVPLRYRHDEVENRKQTTIEADLDRDDFYETTITLDGHRMFVVIVEQA